MLASKVAKHIQNFVDQHTTVSVERATLRLLGVNEAHKGMALANLVVDQFPKDKLARGICHWLARAMIHHKASAVGVCLKAAEGRMKWDDLPELDVEEIQNVLESPARQAIKRLQDGALKKKRLKESFGGRDVKPLKYVIVATGNIHDDVDQAKAAVQGGADCIAVIRSTAQSLIDYVPHGATTEGFGGTYATQENFKIMREALDEIGEKVGRYVRLVNYSSGLCMPEIAVLAAHEGLDFLLNDSMYGILFRDINMKRTFTDQYFSRLVIAHADITINTGEDNYLTTAESLKAFPQVLASQFINEQMGLIAHLREDQLGLGHAFEMDPDVDDSFLYEIAQAEMVREIFPQSPIKYMPPTRHMTGDIFYGHVLDTMFNLVGVMTHQEIQLLGMMTEAIHNPLLQDRFAALKSANYIFKAARDLGDEISWSANGKIVRRARSVLEDAYRLLHKVEQISLPTAIEEGLFANMARDREDGRGLDGVFKKDPRYWNPVLKLLEKEPQELEKSFAERRLDPGERQSRQRDFRDRHRRRHTRSGRRRKTPRAEGTKTA